MKHPVVPKNESFARAYFSLITSPELNDGELRTLLYMMDRGQHKRFYGSQDNIAEAFGKSRRAIIYHFESLERNKFIFPKRRSNRTSEVTFSTKSIPVKENSLQSEMSCTRIDKYNISPSKKELVREECISLAEQFKIMCHIEPNGQLESWVSGFENLRCRGYSLSDILDVLHFITEDKFYKRTVHSPLRLLESDKNGTLWVERFLRESRK